MKKEFGVALVLIGVLSGFAQEGSLPDVAPKAGWDTLPPVKTTARDWPWWRGPHLDNIAPTGQKPPAAWSDETNVVWRAKLPGVGHSSPSIVGDRIYITSGEKTKDHATAWLFCLERATGKTVWQTELYKGPPPRMHPDNAVASATPACDGERVIVPYQSNTSVVTVAVGIDGKVLWRQTIAPYSTIQGYSASPSFYKSAVIVPVEGPKGCYLTALHRQSGDVVWRKSIRSAIESYAPAVVRHVAGRDQLLLIGGTSTRGYDPETGDLLWECEGPARTCVATPVVDRDTVYATGGYPGRKFLAIRADGKGDVTRSHLIWTGDAKAGYVPSPVLHEGLLYAVADQGLMRCYDVKDGRVLWEHDFKTPFYSSPTPVGKAIYLFDRKGKGYIVPAGRTLGTIATNGLPAGVFATPVFLEGRMYLRTLGDFYCFGEAAFSGHTE
ncbi:MAG TPA: PQQ-binding-like beta-propeller repeat protein [Kiritimatiellia bacterium]|nr:PQQ-binding-like beta-propeller repeat protein [Kiritimatiellia bacterium]HPS09416.1 PQQ-binding-like beta-propeller repeat protein [Kiritimatiellia bacterium]